MSDNNTTFPIPFDNITDVCEFSASFVSWMWRVIAPFIILGGLLSNIVVLLVFRYPRCTRSSTLFHLFILAINDSIILSTGPVRYWALYTLNYDLRTMSEFGCKLNYFVIYVSLDFSSWILVSITFERIISVVRPWEIQDWLTVRNASFRLIMLYIILSGINMHFFFTNGILEDAGTGKNVCDTLTAEYRYFENHIFIWIDMLVMCLIPFSIMALSNWYVVSVIRKTEMSKVIGQVPQRQDRYENVRSPIPPARQHMRGKRSIRRDSISEEVSRTLILITAVFFATTLPSSTFLVVLSFVYEPDQCTYANAIMDMGWAITTLLMYVNCGANVFLYTARSRRFRQELQLLIILTKKRYLFLISFKIQVH